MFDKNIYLVIYLFKFTSSCNVMFRFEAIFQCWDYPPPPPLPTHPLIRQFDFFINNAHHVYWFSIFVACFSSPPTPLGLPPPPEPPIAIFFFFFLLYFYLLLLVPRGELRGRPGELPDLQLLLLWGRWRLRHLQRDRGCLPPLTTPPRRGRQLPARLPPLPAPQPGVGDKGHLINVSAIYVCFIYLIFVF